MNRRRVAVVFGGRSVEHDVSIITAQQVMAVLSERHDVVAVFVDKDGRWWTGETLTDIASFADAPPSGARAVELRLGAAVPFVEPGGGRMRRDRPVPVDVVVNAVHGTGGEDGTLLGALELCDVPYVGRGVTASAVSMDKRLTKVVLRDAGIAVLDHVHVERSEWERDREAVLAGISERLGDAVVVKPVVLGSSVGVQRCSDREQVIEALELAFELDRQAIVEPVADADAELNVAVLGHPGGELVISEVERPLGGPGGLSFEDKYLSGGKGKGPTKTAAGAAKDGGMAAQGRVIPADVPDHVREEVRRLAAEAHRALRLAGVVRYDFFWLGDERGLVLNEANTVPGSFAFYLFEHAGLAFADLCDRLLEIAEQEEREERGTRRSFESVLLRRHLQPS